MAMCGIHALNNALGAHYFDPEDMEHAADTFIAENPDLGDERGQHLAPNGDYSIEVMMMALRTKAMAAFDRICWHMEGQRALSGADLVGCLGAVQNRRGTHWVALKCRNEQFVLLDSLRNGAQLLTEEELNVSLRRHPTYAIRLL